MSRRLQDNLTSSYLEAANRLSSKHQRKKITAYVESYDDVFFWRSILSQFENDEYYFEVMLPSRDGGPVHKSNGEWHRYAHHKPQISSLKSQTGQVLERGKKAALMSALSGKTGQWLIACVDADYDYLIQGATETSRKILNSPFVFHTYAYAIENMQCYAPSLHDVCVAVTLNDHVIFDMRQYLEDFSEAIWPLFVWNIWYYRSDRYGQFTMTDFLRVIETGAFSMNAADQIIAQVRRKVNGKCKQLQQRNPRAHDSWLKVEADLKRLGATPKTTYLYIQGHHLFDKVVVPMLTKICDKLIRQCQNEIARQSQHGTQRRNELSCYTNSLENVVPMLKKNMGFMLSEPFQHIRQDLTTFMENLSQKPSL